MTTTVAATAPAAPPPAAGGEVEGKFFLVVLAFQRSRQLQGGARPRVDSAGHKFPWVALREAMTGLVSWEVAPAVLPVAAPPHR